MDRSGEWPSPLEEVDYQELFEKHRAEILQILARHGLSNPRLFGSVLHGTYRPDSDIDLLVDASPGASLLALSGAELELKNQLGLAVDLRTPEDLSRRFRQRVVSEACPLEAWKETERKPSMSPQLRDRDYLGHIQDALAKIHRQGSRREDFFRREEVQDSVIRGLEIIGEAVSRLSPQLKEAHPEIPWQKISGLRNRLIHGYFDVQLERVWQTVQEEVPAFEASIRRVVENLGPSAEDKPIDGDLTP
jgi:uncharacterized protein